MAAPTIVPSLGPEKRLVNINLGQSKIAVVRCIVDGVLTPGAEYSIQITGLPIGYDIADIFSGVHTASPHVPENVPIEQTITAKMKGYYYYWTYPPYNSETGPVSSTENTLKLEEFQIALGAILGDSPEEALNSMSITGQVMTVISGYMDIQAVTFGIAALPDFYAVLHQHFGNAFEPIGPGENPTTVAMFVHFSSFGDYIDTIISTVYEHTHRALLFLNLNKIRAYMKKLLPEHADPPQTLEFTIKPTGDLNFILIETYKKAKRFTVTAENTNIAWEITKNVDGKFESNVNTEINVSIDFETLLITLGGGGGEM